MRKIFPALVLISALAILALPLAASAQGGPQECCKVRRAITIDTATCAAGQIAKPSATSPCSFTGTACPTPVSEMGKWGIFCAINSINIVVDFIFFVLIAVAVLLGILGAIQIITAGGDPARVGTGRSYIMYAVIGLAVALVVRVIPSLAQMLLGA